MNKFTKASVAGAVGIALLLGGAGSFATWNASATVDAGSIHSGSLTLAANNDGVWNNVTKTATPVEITAPGAFHMVPGNVLEYTRTLTIVGVGDDLTAEMTSNIADFDQKEIMARFVVTAVDGPISVAGTTVSMSQAGTAHVRVTVTLSLPGNATGSQSEAVDLTALTFSLKQILP